MSNHAHHTTATAIPHAHHDAQTRRRNRVIAVVATIAVVALGAVLAVALTGTSSRSSTTAAGAALRPTGETSAMGMPVMTTPGQATGTATAGGIEVTGSTWHLGRVPLNIAVRPTWTLHNTTARPITLGEPRPEVRTGCCPGALTLGTKTVAPGASTTLTFELSMHPGMDGAHDMIVHVPVSSTTGATDLALEVTGDFRN